MRCGALFFMPFFKRFGFRIWGLHEYWPYKT